LNVIVLTNSDGGPAPLAQNIARAVLGIPLVPMPRPLVALALSDSLRDRVPGVYDFGKFTLHVTLEDGRLMAQPDGPGHPRVRPLDRGTLRFGPDVARPMFATFVNDKGKVSKPQFTQRGGPPVEGIRKP